MSTQTRDHPGVAMQRVRTERLDVFVELEPLRDPTIARGQSLAVGLACGEIEPRGAEQMTIERQAQESVLRSPLGIDRQHYIAQ